MGVKEGEKVLAADTASAQKLLPGLVEKAARDRAAVEEIEKQEIGAINYRIEQARLQSRKLDFQAQEIPGRDLTAARALISKTIAEQKALFQAKTEELQQTLEAAATTYVAFKAGDGREKEVRSLDIYRTYPANQLGWWGRLLVNRTPRAGSFPPSSAR